MLLLAQFSAAETTSFIAIGDFGTGDWRQHAVASAISTVCENQDCDLVLGLGDNIYERGVTSLEDLSFLTRFEIPYTNIEMPFYMTLGNHDISQVRDRDPTLRRGDIQVQYHYKTDRFSDKWYMPARYYHALSPKDSGGPIVDFLSLDSSTVAGDNSYQSEYDQQEQLTSHTNWLNNLIPTLQGRWRVAFAHYPYISNGRHGNAGDFDGVQGRGQAWKQLLDTSICNQVHLLVTAHDHTLQFLQRANSCGQTMFILSGAGGKREGLVDKERNPAFWQAENTLGFFWVQLSNDKMTVQAWVLNSDNKPERAWQSTHDFFPVSGQ